VHQVDSIVFFGKNSFSTSLLSLCAENDVTISFLSRNGFFEGRVCGPVSGNVLLRKRQYETIDDEAFSQQFVRDLLYCKIKNGKTVLMRHARSTTDTLVQEQLVRSVEKLSAMAEQLAQCQSIAAMRGVEGAAATVYFSQFDGMLKASCGFRFETRSRRPPQNEVNAVLSFLYTMLAHDVRSALETVGLDPAAGYLHRLRPGRDSFALDLMEELRAPLCDRLTLSLFNKGQLSEQDFDKQSQAVYLNEKGRRLVLSQWRSRKQEEIQHPFLEEKISIGLIPYTQAMLFARRLRGDLDRYPPFVWR
jgi:CRISPR-associated protein Cas1